MMLVSRMTTWAAALAVLSASASALVGCAATADDSEEQAASSEEALRIGAGFKGKTKGDLEADGYTCKLLEGTTLTLCWKNGSPSYSCDAQGRCTQNLVRSTGTFVAPAPSVLAP